jgi:hypothetical protein
MANNEYLKGTVFTEKEDDFIRLHYVQLSQRAMALRLARTRTEIVTRMKHLDLKLTKEEFRLKKQAAGLKWRDSITQEQFWTQEKDSYLRDNYEKKLNKELAKELGITSIAISTRASRLGLRKSQSYLKRLRKDIIPKLRYCGKNK